MTMKHLHFYILLFVTLSGKVYAAYYPPVFTGNWYTDADYIDQYTNGTRSYRYTNWAHGTASSYAAKVLSDLTPHKDCVWGNPYLKEKNNFRPYDFEGSLKEWQAITAKENSITSENWQRDCVNTKNTLIDSATVTILPNYACPKGTHFMCKQGVSGCSDASYTNDADLVGRDLALPIKPTEAFGHVAIMLHASNVLEALHKPDGIYENTLASFLLKSKYWGEKFGLPQKPSLTVQEATNIIDIGKIQQKFEFKYTYLWNWQPGSKSVHEIYNEATHQWRTIYGTDTIAIFRCDSLIHYCYAEGAQVDIFPGGFKFPYIPLTMFHAFKSFRLAKMDLTAKQLIKPYLSLPTENLSAKEKLTKIFNQNEISIEPDLAFTYSYLEDKNVPRAEKMEVFFNLAKQHQSQSVYFSMLMDFLMQLNPIELIPELVDFYHHQTDSENKDNLLKDFNELIVKISNLPQNQRAVNVNNVLLIQHLFQEVIENEINPDLLKDAIQMYPDIGAPESAKNEINQALQRAEHSHIDLGLTPIDLKRLQLDIAFTTKETQTRDLPQLLSASLKHNGPEPLPFLLCFRLRELPATQVNEQIKPLLQQYLITHKNLLFNKANNADDTMSSFFSSCNWLSAYATVNIKDNSEKLNYIFKYIRSEPSILSQANYIQQQSKDILSNISQTDLLYYQTRFQQKLKETSLSDLDRHIYESALSNLNYSLTPIPPSLKEEHLKMPHYDGVVPKTN